jgi:hypothetical protein
MATYPALPIVVGATEEPVNDYHWNRDQAGAGSSWFYYDADRRRFHVKHSELTLTQKQTLDAFYVANRAVEFQFVWLDKVTYTVVFAMGLRRSAPYAARLFNIDAVLEEV